MLLLIIPFICPFFFLFNKTFHHRILSSYYSQSLQILYTPSEEPSMLWERKPRSRWRTYVTSRDFNDRVHVLFLEILCHSGKTLFDISVNTGQICMKFEADTPQKLLKYAHLTKFSNKQLI